MICNTLSEKSRLESVKVVDTAMMDYVIDFDYRYRVRLECPKGSEIRLNGEYNGGDALIKVSQGTQHFTSEAIIIIKTLVDVSQP